MDVRVPTLTVSHAALDEQKSVALLIDDSPDVHRLLSIRLRNDGLELLGATCGADGVRKTREAQPSVILLDIDMPGMDGFEVLRALKDSDETLHIPVIMLSSSHSAQDKVTAFDLGAVDFITKPFDVTELRVRVRSALRVSHLLQMLAKLASVDGLTGLYNRSHFDQRCGEAVAAARRHDRSLSLALIDLDHFKSVNDTYGHPAGDSVLQSLAKLLRRECRQSDVACRYGGEEFALLMPETTPEDAAGLCERVRQSLGSIVWPSHPERSITCSVGVVGATGACALGPEAWVELADRNLYRAKREGRNRVVVSRIDSDVRLSRAG